jgi:hypothetical protein
VAPWLAYRTGLRDAVQAERDLLARERSAVAAAASHPTRDADLRNALDSARPWLLDASSSIAASGALSRALTELGRASGVLVQEIQARVSEEGSGSLQAVAVSLRALGDLEGLARLLHGIESARALLVTSELTLRPAGVNDGDVERGQLMSLGVVVSGLWIKEESSSVAAAPREVRP